jgi:hypothetical protein
LITKNGDGKPQQYPIYKKDICQWQESYPAIDAKQVIREIRQWNIDNPINRKTKSGIRKHINTWMKKEQNSARTKKKKSKVPVWM